MAVPANAHDLLDQLCESQLLTRDQADYLAPDLDQSATPTDAANLLVNRGLLTQFQAEEAAKGNAADLALGPYRILEAIGMGGMGGVFKAVDSRLKRVVALKMIRYDLAQNPDYVRRFRREAEAAAQLMHPNVVVIYDVGEANDTHYIAMEYVEGIDLAQLVKQQGVLPIQVACDYIRQAALGLQHAHERGVIHRDIKPGNLLVAKPTAGGLRSGPIRLPARPMETPAPGQAARAGTGVVKVLDMGLARQLDAVEQSALTHIGSVIGTPDFIAPEQANDASSVDHRADLYSLGCTFYYLLTGSPPYPEGTPFDKLKKHASDKITPRPVEEFRRGIPPDVSQILNHMMAKNPDHRYQSAHDVAEDLAAVRQRLFSGQSPAAPAGPPAGAGAPVAVADTPRPKVADTPPAPTYALNIDSVVLPARRSAAITSHKGYVSALAFTSDGNILATAGVDDSVRLWDLGPMFDRAAGRPAELAVLRGGLDMTQALAFDPSNTYLITGSANAQLGPMWRWQWREADPDRARTMLPSQPIQVDALAFSPDGTKLAATVREALFVWKINAKGIAKYANFRGHNTSARAVAFALDGKRLALGGEDTTIRIYEFGWLRHNILPPLKGHTDAITSLCYSPNGSLIVTGGKDATIRLWDSSGADRAARAVLTGHRGAVRLVRFTPRGDQLVSVGDGGQVQLWDVASQSPVREWMVDKSMIHGVAMSPDCRYLAIGTDGLVSLYDLELIMGEQLAPTTAGI